MTNLPEPEGAPFFGAPQGVPAFPTTPISDPPAQQPAVDGGALPPDPTTVSGGSTLGDVGEPGSLTPSGSTPDPVSVSGDPTSGDVGEPGSLTPSGSPSDPVTVSDGSTLGDQGTPDSTLTDQTVPGTAVPPE
jgi:hypothetical protein